MLGVFPRPRVAETGAGAVLQRCRRGALWAVASGALHAGGTPDQEALVFSKANAAAQPQEPCR